MLIGNLLPGRVRQVLPSGNCRLADLITRYGQDEKLFAFTADVAANCTRKHARSDSDPCGAICPDPGKRGVKALR